MKMTRKIGFIALVFLILSLNVNSQDLKNYFSISEISLSNTVYKLAWSSHPNAVYYKHEYLATGEKPESFKNMVMIDAIVKDLPIEKVVGLKESELQERKQTDKVCNYQIMDNSQTGEYMIDFLMSTGKGDNLDIVEWNVYRYKKISDSKENPIILLFAMSKRAYGNDITAFLTELKSNRTEWINLIGNYKLPTIDLKE